MQINVLFVVVVVAVAKLQGQVEKRARKRQLSQEIPQQCRLLLFGSLK